jgi:hypothetical protein
MNNKKLIAALMVYANLSFALTGINALSELQTMVASNDTKTYPLAQATSASSNTTNNPSESESFIEVMNTAAQQARFNPEGRAKPMLDEVRPTTSSVKTQEPSKEDTPSQGMANFLDNQGMVLVQQLMQTNATFSRLLVFEASVPTLAKTVEFLVLLHEVKQGHQMLDLLTRAVQKNNTLLTELLKRQT